MKYLNYLKLVFVACIAAFLLQACCKAYCGTQTFVIRYINFKNTDIDTVLFTKYVANGKFDQKIDSIYLNTSANQADTMYSVLTQTADYAKDWKIKILSNNREYSLTEIKTANERCTCENSTYKVIAGYRLDGALYPNDIIELKK